MGPCLDCVLTLRASVFAAFVGTSWIVPEEFPGRWEFLRRSGLLRSGGDSPFCLKPWVSAPAITNKVSLIFYPAVCVFAA